MEPNCNNPAEWSPSVNQCQWFSLTFYINLDFSLLFFFYLYTCSSCMLEVYLMLMLCMHVVHVCTDDSSKINTLANVRQYLIKFHVLHMVTLFLMYTFRMKAASWPSFCRAALRCSRTSSRTCSSLPCTTGLPQLIRSWGAGRLA